MNQSTFATSLASALKYLVALFVGFLIAKGVVTSDFIKTLDPEIANAIQALATVGSAVIFGAVQHFLAKRKGSGTTGSGGNLVPLLCMMAVLSMALPSCNLPFEYPITGSIGYRDPDSGAKGGLVFRPGEKPKASVKIPRYDEQGNLIGWIELEGPLSREVKVNPAK